jgi:hypothetical protein
MDRCEHFPEHGNASPRTHGCEECLALGVSWTELRMCLTCGHVGCCEDSQYAHALAHFNATGHPMIASYDPPATWGWCYPHKRYFDPMPGTPIRRKSLLGRLAGRIGRRR